MLPVPLWRWRFCSTTSVSVQYSIFFAYLCTYNVHTDWKNMGKTHWDQRIPMLASLERCSGQEEKKISVVFCIKTDCYFPFQLWWFHGDSDQFLVLQLYDRHLAGMKLFFFFFKCNTISEGPSNNRLNGTLLRELKWKIEMYRNKRSV